MSAPREYVLLCGYYPDIFASHDMPPDVFFQHFFEGADMLAVVDDIEYAIAGKYRLDEHGNPYSRPFDVQDCFWSCEAKPIALYTGADEDYPVNPC